MTKNQIEYSKLLETRRANLVSEALTARRDTAARELGLSQLAETSRANRAREANAQLVYLESTRANRAREAEQHRSNVTRENEEQRANQAREFELNRSNVAREQETNRANVASENLSAARLAEDVAHHAAQEIRLNLERSEQARANLANEGARAAELAERVRHDLVMEAKSYGTTVSLNQSSQSTPMGKGAKSVTAVPGGSQNSSDKRHTAKPDVRHPGASEVRSPGKPVQSQQTVTSRGTSLSLGGSLIRFESYERSVSSGETQKQRAKQRR